MLLPYVDRGAGRWSRSVRGHSVESTPVAIYVAVTTASTPSQARPRLIVVGPVPPPLHGVTVSTTLVLANARLRERFDVRHLDTSDHRSGGNIARWDVMNVVLALSAVLRLTGMLRGRPGVLYLPLSQGTAGLLRDSLLIWAASLRGWTVAGHLRGGEFHLFFAALPRPLAAFFRATLQRVDSIGAMGDSLRAMFDGLVDPARVAVVSNGTPDPGPPDEAREPGTILYLSNLRRRKGVVEAMQAARIVLEARPSARFVLAGPSEDDALQAQLEALAAPVADRVEFLGKVDLERKTRLLAQAGVLLFPPVEPEGHPRVVLEAVAAGLPVVATDRGAIAETVVDGVTGFVLDQPDPQGLARRLLELHDDPALRKRMGEAARERFVAEFSQDRADEKLTGWLAGLARERGLLA